MLTAFRQPFEVREYPLLGPAPGALLLRVDVSSVCGTDIHFWDGSAAESFPVELPVILGHEGVGTIVAFGSGTETDSVGNPLREGDRVIWTPESCLACRQCVVEKRPELCPNRYVPMAENCENPPHFGGTFAEYVYVPPKAGRLRVPEDVKSEWASAASCALRTVINAFERVGDVDYRHAVVIQGAGPLGLFATALAAASSPRMIVVVGGPDERLDVARAWGADHVVSVDRFVSEDERIGEVRALTGGGPEVLVEVSGAPGAFAEGLEMAAVGARYAVVGTLGGPPTLVKPQLISTKGLTLLGQLSGTTDSYYKALAFLRAQRDRFDWDLLFSNRYDLESVSDCMENMKAYREIKPLIYPWG